MGIPEDRRPSFYIPGNHMKKSPYIGVFRHAPPAFHWGVHRSCRSCQQPPSNESNTGKIHGRRALTTSTTVPREEPMISGMLPGGAEYDRESRYTTGPETVHGTSYPPLTWLDEKVSDSINCSRATSSIPQAHLCRSLVPAYRTVRRLQDNWASHSALIALLTLRLPNVFRRLLLLDNDESPSGRMMDYTGKSSQLHENDEVYESDDDLSRCTGNGSTSGSSCCSGSSSDSYIDGCSSSSTLQKPLNSLSSEVDHSSSVALLLDLLDSSDDSQLDYIITQTDIARMARNASRHLDVASILSLPTLTYKAPPPRTVTITTDEEGKGERQSNAKVLDNYTIEDGATVGMWSWFMVPKETVDLNPLIISNGQKQETTGLCTDKNLDTTEDDHQQSCVICLDNFQEGDKLRVLPCGHLFHTGCIDHWLLGTYSDEDCVTSGCPMCKKHASTPDEDVSPTSADGTVPSWAFARLGDALAKEADGLSAPALSKQEELSQPSSVSVSS